jgi:hypothetical protein
MLNRAASYALAAVVTMSVALLAPQGALGQNSNTIVSGFSGTVPVSGTAMSSDPTDGLFIDRNGASARILSIDGRAQPQGQIVAAATVAAVKAADVGQVFGITLDDGRGPDGTLSGPPDIYFTATSAFGLQIIAAGPNGAMQRLKSGQPGAQWMPGQWGDPSKGATPGSIWRVSGMTGAVSLFANVAYNGQPNSGASLGAIAFDAQTRQLFVSDLETGMIHRLSMQGQELGYFDHGTQGRLGQGLPPIPYDSANRLDITNAAFSVNDASTWHHSPKGRRVWGLRISAGRLYYAVVDGPQVWSVSIGDDGNFRGDARLEINVNGTASDNAISDIKFDGTNAIYLAQRGTARGDYSYETFADPATSQVIRYTRDPQTGKWAQAFEEYAVGFPPDFKNANGGVAIDVCTSRVWATGELLRQGSGQAGPQSVHGLQGMDKSLVRPANAPPAQSLFAEYDPSFEDLAAHGHIGLVEIESWCQGAGQDATTPPVVTHPLIPPTPSIVPPQLPPGGFNLTLTKQATPFYCPPGAYCIPHPQNPQSTDCVQGGGGVWICSFKIIVQNTGPTPYSGPLDVVDWLPANLPGATMTFAPQPPWACSLTGSDQYTCHYLPSVTLNLGDSVELRVVVNLPANYQSCSINNAATIQWPAGYGDSNPADDMADVSANIPGANCPQPHGDKTNLTLKKFAISCLTGFNNAPWRCDFQVVITNTGPGIYNDKIDIEEMVPTGTTLAGISAPWICSGGPPTYHCDHPPVAINPGQSVSLFVGIDMPKASLQPGQCAVTNHAHIAYAPGGSNENTDPSDDDASATANIPSPQCLGNKTNLKLEKTADTCVADAQGYRCHYVITVTNTGPGVYDDTIVVDDTVPPGATWDSNAPSSWTCSGGPPTYSCHYPKVKLNPNDARAFEVWLRVNAASLLHGVCTLTNKAHISQAPGGSNENTNPADDDAFASAVVPNTFCTGNAERKPGDHITIPCPSGGVFSIERRSCVQPPGQRPQCPPGTSGDYPNCRCQTGLTFNADRGTCDLVGNTCPPPRSQIGNACVCPVGTVYHAANNTCTLRQVICTGGHVPGPEGMCVCPTDKPALANGVCAPRQLTVCSPPLVLQPNGSCGCPPGESYRNGRCVPEQPKLNCPAGASGSYPRCVCLSAREEWNGSACVPKTVNPSGHGGSACPPPVRGTLPNCACPRGETWNGSACIALPNLKGTKHRCPTGQTWNGAACIGPPRPIHIPPTMLTPHVGGVFRPNIIGVPRGKFR